MAAFTLHTIPELQFDLHRPRVCRREAAQFCINRYHDRRGANRYCRGDRGKTNTSGRSIGVAGGYDALPSQRRRAEYASKTSGPRCTPAARTAYRYAALVRRNTWRKTRNFDGRAVLIFQNRERRRAASSWVEEGLMERWSIDESVRHATICLFSLSGPFRIACGALLARRIEFDIQSTGQGGHAAAPHESD